MCVACIWTTDTSQMPRWSLTSSCISLSMMYLQHVRSSLWNAFTTFSLRGLIRQMSDMPDGNSMLDEADQNACHCCMNLSWVVEQHDQPTADAQWAHRASRRELQFCVTILLYTALMSHHIPHHPLTAMMSVTAAGSGHSRSWCMILAVTACRNFCLTDS